MTVILTKQTHVDCQGVIAINDAKGEAQVGIMLKSLYDDFYKIDHKIREGKQFLKKLKEELSGGKWMKGTDHIKDGEIQTWLQGGSLPLSVEVYGFYSDEDQDSEEDGASDQNK